MKGTQAKVAANILDINSKRDKFTQKKNCTRVNFFLGKLINLQEIALYLNLYRRWFLF